MLSARTLQRTSLRRLLHTTAKVAKEVTLKIDDTPVTIEAGSSIIQAAEKAGIKIPRYCYHDKLPVAGNCRMCLVEVEHSRKMAAACAMPVAQGMHVLTNTETVKKTREGITEFMLSDHPLDCPICDQGGECDLQEQTLRYGSDRGRYNEVIGKRAVENKAIGPLVKTSMNRCIHCTRCVRFLNEIAGAPEFGTTGRGNDLQIGTFVERNLNSELSGNIVDLCPVGALTSKPYAFKARPWELKRTESVDVMDALGCAIRVDARGVEVMRILPRTNEEINEDWISDRSRYSCDALKVQRLTTPLVKTSDKLAPAGWDQALGFIATKIAQISPAENEVQAVAGPFTDVETLVSAKDLVNRLNSENLASDDSNLQWLPNPDIRSNYLFNSSIEGIDECDSMLIVGSNPRFEAAVLNARIRARWLNSDMKVYHVGEKFASTFDMTELGATAADLKRSLSGAVGKELSQASKPMIIVGSGVLDNPDAAAIDKAVRSFAEQHADKFNTSEWQGLNLLHRQASRVGAMDVGFVAPSQKVASTKPKVVFLLGADEMTASLIPKDAFVVYIGHHGDLGASLADVVLPASAYTEKPATFVNTEGRSQTTRAAVGPPGAARDDWKILKALSEYLGVGLPYENIRQLHSRIATIAPHLVRYDCLESVSPEIAALALDTSGHRPRVTGAPLVNPIQNYYFTDVISRNSKTMAQCVGSFGAKIDKTHDDNAHDYLGVA